MSAPVRSKQFKTADFAAYLAQNGAEVGIPTNGYEVIRYKAFWQGSQKAQTHIVYTRDNGLLTYTGASREHYEAFQAGDALPETEATLDEKRVRRIKNTSGIRQKLRDRDGDHCWFCGGHTTATDSNVEHLINISDGGTNALANLVLAHTDCNTKAGNMTLAKKLELRAELRARDTDGSPKGPDRNGLDGEAATAGAEGIAHD
jgi:hypothetical protein